MSNKIAQCIAAFAALLMLVPALGIGAEPKVMVATNTSGRVTVQSANGVRRNIVSTQVLHSGDSLSTADNSLATVQLADVGKVKLGPTTTATTYSRSGELDVHLASGSMCVQSEQPAVSIYAGGVSLAAANPSTIFDLEQNTGDTKVAVYQGSVTATTPGNPPKQLPAGTAAAAAPGGTVHSISLASINVDFAGLDCPAPAVAEAALALGPAAPPAASGSSSGGGVGGIIAVLVGLGAIAAAAHGGGGGSHSGPMPGPVFPTSAPTGTPFPHPSSTPAPSITPSGLPTGTPPPTGVPSPTPFPTPTPVPTPTPLPTTTPLPTPTPFPTATATLAAVARAPMSASVSSLVLGAVGAAQSVRIANASGTIRASASSSALLISPSSAPGPNASFTVVGRGPGQATVTFVDDGGRTTSVRVVIAGRR